VPGAAGRRFSIIEPGLRARSIVARRPRLFEVARRDPRIGRGCASVSTGSSSASGTVGSRPWIARTAPLSDTIVPSSNEVWPLNGLPVPELLWLSRLVGLK
jgi:hypothetical protein